MPWRMTLTTTCRIAPRRRSDPALPTTSRGPVGPMTIEGAIMLVSRLPARRARHVEVELAEHVVQLDARARDDHARP